MQEISRPDWVDRLRIDGKPFDEVVAETFLKPDVVCPSFEREPRYIGWVCEHGMVIPDFALGPHTSIGVLQNIHDDFYVRQFDAARRALGMSDKDLVEGAQCGRCEVREAYHWGIAHPFEFAVEEEHADAGRG